MHYEEDEHRRRQHERRMQEERRRNRGEQEINDFRSRWDEPSPGYLHPRERQWSEEERARFQDRERFQGRNRYREGERYPERGSEHEQELSRRNREQYYHNRRNDHLFRHPDNRQQEHEPNDEFNRDNQHANDRWQQNSFRQRLDRYTPERRRRSSRDEDDWNDHRR